MNKGAPSMSSEGGSMLSKLGDYRGIFSTLGDGRAMSSMLSESRIDSTLLSIPTESSCNKFIS